MSPHKIETGGFDPAWLLQREPFDLAARDPALARAFTAALPQRRATPLRLVDLAAGSGANLRALAPSIKADQDWLLVDHDPLLLAAQHAHITAWATRHGWHTRQSGAELQVHTGTTRWRVRSQALDLVRSLDALDLASFDCIVTTAFLDLVSAAWLDRFCLLIARARRPLLATLTVDGPRHWQPPHPADAELRRAFLQHQGGDKGFGPALGPAAVTALAERLGTHDLSVRTARSDWQIGSAHAAMLTRLVDEAAAVAQASAPASAQAFADWRAMRHAQIASGALRLTVGHADLLAT